jgi:hypothetical protein
MPFARRLLPRARRLTAACRGIGGAIESELASDSGNLITLPIALPSLFESLLNAQRDPAPLEGGQ